MSEIESQFPIYLYTHNWFLIGEGAVAARQVETTATVLFYLDVHGRVIGVEILGEMPTYTEWATEDQFGNQFINWEGGKDAAVAVRNDHTSGYRYSLLRRQVTEWVEVDEKETRDA